jgi:hypothetical protein
VSRQIVLRALIEEGLKRDHPSLLANVEGQAKAVRFARSAAGRVRAEGGRGNLPSGSQQGLSSREPGSRRT